MERHRYLVKDIDHFAGFAHAIHTYLGGVALASYHNMSLLHLPFQSSHGLGCAFDDFLAGDTRGLVEPQAAPVLTSDTKGRLLIDGRVHTVSTIPRTASAASITQRLLAAPDNSVSHVRKGRFAFVDADPALCVNCTVTPEARYTALWIRERFWRAVRSRDLQQKQQRRRQGVGAPRVKASPLRSRRSSGRASSAKITASTTVAETIAADAIDADAASSQEVPAIRIAIHVRRGDVTYLDRYGRPSARWVETNDMLRVLKGAREVIGQALEPPRVHVQLFSESKGWFANDTEALRRVAPHAAVHLDSSAAATIDALMAMSRSDLLLMGTSGFSTWSAIFSCGVKIGPAVRPMMPMRHVAYANSLVSRSPPFEEASLSTLRAVWGEYWACKRNATCRPTLCAPTHLSDPRWASSPSRGRAWRGPMVLSGRCHNRRRRPPRDH